MKRREILSAAMFAALLPARTARAASEQLRFRDLYSRGRDLTERVRQLEGQRIEMVGYMAPPLKPEIAFFVLTKLPMSTCPFCESEAQWPDDIVLALTNGPVAPVRYTDLVRASGILETGFETDPETGFVSFIRLRDTRYEKL